MTENYPIGTNTKEAPWNQQLEKEIEVTISLTLSKTTKILVNDYKISKDEEDKPYVDYSECDLRTEVINQVYLPGYDDHDTWNIDDFEVELE